MAEDFTRYGKKKVDQKKNIKKNTIEIPLDGYEEYLLE